MSAITQALPRATDASPWYTHRWPWLLMIGPLWVVIGGCTMMWLALSQPDALVVGDYYKQGKAINQDLRRDRVASSLGLVFEAGYDALRGRVTGRLESHGKPVLAPFRIRLAHPTQPERDRVLEALPDAQGRFSAGAPELENTHWQVIIEGAARDWRLAGSWSWAKRPVLRIVADTGADASR
jgi:hypothetical protein